MGLFQKFKSLICGLLRPKTPQPKGVLIRRPLCYYKIIKSLIHVPTTVQSIPSLVPVSSNTSKQIKHPSSDNFVHQSQNSTPQLRVSTLIITDKYIKKK